MGGGNLILGLAAGYHYGDVRPFLASLNRAAYAGDLVFFVSETTRDLERMRAHGAELLPMDRAPGLKDVPCNALRYFLYLEYLRTCGKTYDRILISDVRDVIFQRNPFAFPWPEGVGCALEDPSATVGSCPFNARWVREHLGETDLAAIADRPVSCSGTTVADHASMLAYLEKMTGLLLPPSTGECMAGYDQGVHNHLVHTGGLDGLTLFDNAGPILTLAQTRGEPALDARGEVLNRAGRVAHMVHQYDRKPSLFKMIRERFA
ncbi:MAG: hypothetical protein AB7D39_00570 [Pseudodesulfovibrio sp.]|uniref:hypothetical protein n=1 Tax=Pseudodesulfovibrio sp. TaxID=2035812 RepID=UPI003D11B6F8